jgi:hypothetical protein
MIAHKSVVVVSKDGTRTTADQLLVDNKDGKNNVKLLGQPYAMIMDKKSTIAGPIIEIFPDLQRLEVVGAGMMRGTQQAEKQGGVERPIDVKWERGMTFDGKANVADVSGKVLAITTDADGAKNTAQGERVRMLLADVAPTTKPTTRQVADAGTATTRATTKPAKGPSSGMASKTVRHITFDENAEVSSVTLADDGTLLKRTHLTGATIEYDMIAKRMTVPVEGRMLVEDHRPAPVKPTVGGAAGDPRQAGGKVGDPESNRGSTAFAWSKRFTYDDAARQAVMEGDMAKPVRVVHRDDSASAKEYQLTGDTVTADMEEVAVAPAPAANVAGGAAAATTPTTRPATKVQLRRVTSTGHIWFTGPGAQIRALYLEFDPKTHWLIARGNEREMVDFNISSQPGGPKLAEEVQYNTESGEVKAVRPQVRMGR